MLRLDSGERHAACVEFGGVRFSLRAGEYIHLIAPTDILEARVLEEPIPLCLQQRTGDSAGPEIDVVLRVLVDGLLNDNVRDLEAPAAPEDAIDLLHDGHLVRGEVDDAVANDDVD